MSDMAGDAAR